ncbi:DUF4174 domain-containing protein [Parvularcula flava]|uniref:DUF4174 domain-containing protein n=1 Tax=Aquisalinus luteolus TaxID=1566827 RepID=A0A8J3A2T6_9PROT|nr:DUF4174 domain-containing protein [Aquisalinus luteolus]NHK28548.1 DUF4174 domain-containing protein [Aquisalinus luteolus]GGH98808.1 hypothetical protein GCM10011355_23270 [Aquisalinus luteolus]
MNRFLNLIAALAVSLLPAAAAKADTMKSLTEYQWSHRPVLVFDAAGGHERVATMDPEGDGGELKDRDILLVYVIGNTVTLWDGNKGERVTDTADELRDRFDLTPQDFAVILIGKDGGEKGRWSEPPSWEEDIFPLIDSMPMRQREMQGD